VSAPAERPRSCGLLAAVGPSRPEPLAHQPGDLGLGAMFEASAMARCGSPLAPTIEMMVAATMGPSEESGPSTRTLEGPKLE
jgi:hypothetical protein